MLFSDDTFKLNHSLGDLKSKHKNLDEAIQALRSSPQLNHIEEHRLKKEKLRIKDAIEQLQAKLRPNIIA